MHSILDFRTVIVKLFEKHEFCIQSGVMFFDVWKISRSDEYPEPVFVVNACPIEIEAEQDGTVLFGYGSISASDAVAIECEAALKEDMCVKPGR